MDESSRQRAELSAGELPPGWQILSLRELSRGEGRYGSSEPGHPFDPGAPRYIRITDVSEEGTLRSDSRASLPAHKARSFKLAPGDLLFARSGATVGKSYLYDPGDGDCAFAGYLICFGLDPERCVPDFVARFAQSTGYWSWVKRTLRQAAQPNINAAEFGALPVPVPPLDEQRRIALLLCSMDRLIRTQARIVDTLTTMKTALLHELMTFGIDEQGALGQDRPRRDSPIGPVPAHWKVEPVEALLSSVDPAMRSGPFGSDLKKSDLVEEGVPLLGMDNVEVDAFVPRYKRFVSRARYPRFERYAVRPGDVMITIMGTVGRSCVVPEHVRRALSSKHVWVLTLDRARYVPALASLQFNHARWVRQHFHRDEQGGTMAAIRSETLRSTLLPVPPLGEQRRIAEVLRVHEARLACERAALEKHRTTRRALVDALFTGRLRI
jgi:type I restriction enzyme, S subunit